MPLTDIQRKIAEAEIEMLESFLQKKKEMVADLRSAIDRVEEDIDRMEADMATLNGMLFDDARHVAEILREYSAEPFAETEEGDEK